ncbi:MAG: calcium/sodium antiporter [Acidobacteriota bacterium]|nr:MAG: calcium/sodium antiporter [Acidobacteriota bacterium]
MSLDALILIGGLASLLLGGDLVVRGASAVARQLGVSPLIVGLSIVAFGTSAPELAVNVIAAVVGEENVSFGNVLGSNMANVGLILALMVLVRPVAIEDPVVRRELPMMLLATGAVIVMGLDEWLERGASGFDRYDALLLLLLFAVFVYYTLSDVLYGGRTDPYVREVEEMEPSRAGRSIWINLLLTIAGLAALVAGGRAAVAGGVGIARAWGVSEAIIGLTMIAVGTSLPELVTSLVAVVRHQSDLAIGNIVGSNIFNLLFVLGVTSTVRTVPVPRGGYGDLIVNAALSLLVYLFAASGRRRIVRWQGLLLLALYLGYVSWRTLAG